MLGLAGLVSLAMLNCEDRAVVVAIQPLGHVSQNEIKAIEHGILGQYRVEFKVLKAIPLPRSAYYAPRSRYRAEKLLAVLDDTRGEYDKVLGLTAVDVSTTGRGHADWGIFGLGRLGGRSCVVSKFRLSRRPSRKSPRQRLIEVVNHELGHTFGLPHCPDPRCLMADAEGTIKTLDNSTGRLCKRCREKAQPASVVR